MAIKKKFQDILKSKKYSLKKQQAPAIDSDMVRMLQLLDKRFKTPMIKVRAPVDKVDSMQEQRNNVSRAMGFHKRTKHVRCQEHCN